MENQYSTLFLVSKDVDLYKKKIRYVDFFDIYNRNIPTFLLRCMRNIPLTVGLCLSIWKKKLSFYRTIIVFDTEATLSLLKWIETNAAKGTRLILYYRNSISTVHSGMELWNVKKLNYELWSYNLHDCEKFNLKYNCQMLNSDLMTEEMHEIYTGAELKWDAVFLGKAKGREKIISTLEEVMSNKGLRTYFYVVDFPDLNNNRCRNNRPLPYKDYLRIVANSKAIIDLVNMDNYGLTLRPLEAMFMKKKLITNYADIVRYDFFREENIIQLEDACTDKIKDFLSTEYKELPEEIVDNYDVMKWSSNFVEAEAKS